jgi:hypothetical protein
MADDETTTVEETAPERGEPNDVEEHQSEQEPSAAPSRSEARSEAPKREPGVPPEVKRALAKANKEAETLRLKLKEYEDREKTESQRLADDKAAAESAAADARREADAARLEVTKYQVAREKKLPAEWIDRLRGSSKEELETDADSLLAVLKEQEKRRTPPSYDGGVRKPAASPTDMNSLIRRAATRCSTAT